MPDQKVHIIITGEAGKGRSFALHKKTVRSVCIAAVLLSLCLTAGAIAGLSLYKKNISLESRTAMLGTELSATSAVLENIRAEKARLEQDREDLLENSISRLDERSKIIQEIMDDIGIKVEGEDNPDHSGGPFIALEREYGEHLLELTDRYLDMLKTVPLGRPVPGEISSGFGSRIDPLNKKKAFHPGIDFRGNTGDAIHATADGIVKEVSRNTILGRYIILSHGNGFETIFAHMHKTLVEKGEEVKRGQVIGLIGNTGRSTGSHLHYGIQLHGKSIDPGKYLQFADASSSDGR
jgi:murein DD-endopeptidase MepM/ murein hydrolase activator NlpD